MSEKSKNDLEIEARNAALAKEAAISKANEKFRLLDENVVVARMFCQRQKWEDTPENVIPILCALVRAQKVDDQLWTAYDIKANEAAGRY